jgi:hypothetical protein
MSIKKRDERTSEMPEMERMDNGNSKTKLVSTKSFGYLSQNLKHCSIFEISKIREN